MGNWISGDHWEWQSALGSIFFYCYYSNRVTVNSSYITHVLLCLVAQSSPTLCDPMGCTVHGILQARILQWVAFPFSRRSSHPQH